MSQYHNESLESYRLVDYPAPTQDATGTEKSRRYGNYEEKGATVMTCTCGHAQEHHISRSEACCVRLGRNQLCSCVAYAHVASQESAQAALSSGVAFNHPSTYNDVDERHEIA